LVEEVEEGLLIAVIVFQLSRKSYKPPKKPLTEKARHYCGRC
jgi:serine palmitoyltransferase